MLVPIIITALITTTIATPPADSWVGEWECDMMWDYQGRFADGSTTYHIIIESTSSDYPITIRAEGSRRFGEIKAFGKIVKNGMLIFFDYFIYKSPDFEWNFHKNEPLILLKNIDNQIITHWLSLKPELPDPINLKPGPYFTHNK